MSKIIKIAKFIELHLYKEAASFEDYIDVSTLPHRIALVKSKLKGSHPLKNSEIISQLSDNFRRHCDFGDVLINES